MDRIGVPPTSDHLKLFHNHHPPQRCIIPRLELIEIGAACDRFAAFVVAIPIYCMTPIGIEPCRLMPQIELTHHRASCVINGKGHIGVAGKMVRNPCLRVKGVRVVGEKLRFRWDASVGYHPPAKQVCAEAHLWHHIRYTL